MGRHSNKWIPISKERLKKVLRLRGYTQVELARKLNRTKDNLNSQIRKERIDSDLLNQIAKELDVSVDYLKAHEFDSVYISYQKEFNIDYSDLIPSYYESTETFDTAEKYYMKIGNLLLNMYRLLSSEGTADKIEDVPLLSLQLHECKYLFDEIGIIQKLPSALKTIEQKRKESDHGEKEEERKIYHRASE